MRTTVPSDSDSASNSSRVPSAPSLFTTERRLRVQTCPLVDLDHALRRVRTRRGCALGRITPRRGCWHFKLSQSLRQRRSEPRQLTTTMPEDFLETRHEPHHHTTLCALPLSTPASRRTRAGARSRGGNSRKAKTTCRFHISSAFVNVQTFMTFRIVLHLLASPLSTLFRVRHYCLPMNSNVRTRRATDRHHLVYEPWCSATMMFFMTHGLDLEPKQPQLLCLCATELMLEGVESDAHHCGH